MTEMTLGPDDLRLMLTHARRDNSRLIDKAYRAISVSTRASILYAALDRLHATLDCDDVIRAIDDILMNVVGAQQVAVFELAGDDSLKLVSSSGADHAPNSVPAGEGIIGRSVANGSLFVRRDDPNREGLHWETSLTACIPLRLGKRPFGAITLFALAEQKNDFSSTDLELFRLLETHAAVALRASGLEAAAERT